MTHFGTRLQNSARHYGDCIVTAIKMFLVRKSSKLQKKVLSLRVDDEAGCPVRDFPVKESQYSKHFLSVLPARPADSDALSLVVAALDSLLLLSRELCVSVLCSNSPGARRLQSPELWNAPASSLLIQHALPAAALS
ncbi:hypothetical protein JZ751_026903 [Albula glossodonta]|uniref:Uncharacterized protein n=1 Tax=Albula glossodonta TaxID=121402 RepID=A0A8T2PM42_9TELE|nr:hypothetical protein JZ751_026903 [Albula glossodonta]